MMAVQPIKLASDLYFEDFMVGQEISTTGRTITEADILQFAGLSGDFSQIHVDAEYSRSSPAGQRIAHGMLIASVASGLVVQTGILKDSLIYFREITDWKFIKPVFIGDTIHVMILVSAKKAVQRLSGGLVKMKIDVFNQDQKMVQRGHFSVLVASQHEI
jgi:3-hydroxybutyryl-CoA dehydratase